MSEYVSEDFIKVKCHRDESCGMYDAELGKDALARLRELRLWHWHESQRCRELALVPRYHSYSSQAKDLNNKADQHIKFVQTLNDFFPADDTAEQDAKAVMTHQADIVIKSDNRPKHKFSIGDYVAIINKANPNYGYNGKVAELSSKDSLLYIIQLTTGQHSGNMLIISESELRAE